MKELSEANRRNRRAYMRQYRLDNEEELKRKCREYYWSHREKMLAYGKEYRAKHNTEKDKEYRREYARAMYQVYKERRKQKREEQRKMAEES
jgi:hypothetical protein